MSSHLRVTIVVPVDAASGGVRDCLRSLYGQTFSNLEIIVVDGGASEEASAQAAECASLDPRIRICPKGRESAKTAGLRAASGTHVCFLQASDWLSPTFVEELLQACRRHRVPAARCLSEMHVEPEEASGAAPQEGALASVHPPSRELFSRETVFRDSVVDSSETFLWRPALGTQLTERSFLLKHGIVFPENMPDFEDLAFHVQSAYYAKRVALVAKRLHHGRKPQPNAGNVGVRCQVGGLAAHFHVFRFLERKLPTRFLDGPEYFVLKFQTHDRMLAEIDRSLVAEYRTRAAFDLYFRLKARRAFHYIRVLYKLKPKYGRRASKLYSHYLVLKHNPPNMSPSGVTQHLVQ